MITGVDIGTTPAKAAVLDDAGHRIVQVPGSRPAAVPDETPAAPAPDAKAADSRPPAGGTPPNPTQRGIPRAGHRPSAQGGSDPVG